MNCVPDRIDPWDFIGEKFEQIQSASDADDPWVAEDLEGLILRRERDPMKMDRKSSGKNCQVKINAGECSQTERDAEDIQSVHGRNIRLS